MFAYIIEQPFDYVKRQIQGFFLPLKIIKNVTCVDKRKFLC